MYDDNNWVAIVWLLEDVHLGKLFLNSPGFKKIPRVKILPGFKKFPDSLNSWIF